MPATPYTDQIKAMLEQKYPQSKPLWNYSSDNQLGDGWLWATPINVWGLNYPQFKQAVSGGGPLGLERCTGENGPTQLCYPMDASMTAPGQTAQKVLIGHSDRFVDAMYDVMISAEVLLDITTLSPPTGRFADAIKDALLYLSNKPDGKRPVVRILVSDPLSEPLVTAEPLLHDYTLQISASQEMAVYVYVMSSSFASWNHAKIVAADGTRAIVGGHNMWGPHYLGTNPVFDLSMRLTGTAARHAQDFANNMWAYAQWRKDRLPKFVHDVTGENQRRQYAFAPPAAGGPSGDQPGVLPDPSLYGNASARFPAAGSGRGSTPVLAVGRGGQTRSTYFFPTLNSYVFPFTEPSDEALVKLVSLAQSTVRMSIQTFSAGVGDYVRDIMGWNPGLLQAIAEALNRNVDVYIVLSNPNAGAGGLISASYPGNKPSDVNAKVIKTIVQRLKLPKATAMQLVAQRLRVASIRYSPDDSYPPDVPIGNHAKSMIVDDKVFYIGSQNSYVCNLNEFGYIVEDPAAAQTYINTYWTPLWTWSKSTLTSDADTDVETSEMVEAMLFILALAEDTLLNRQWTALKDQHDKATEPTVLSAIEEQMDELITSANFDTTAATVLDGLKTPFFTGTPPSTEATPEAMRFVINLMNSPDLMLAFNKVVLQPADSVDAANAAITKFLRIRGYSCTVLQVRAAFSAVRAIALAYWSGSYTTWLTDDGGASYGNAVQARAETDTTPVPELGPVLMVDGDTVTIDGTAVVNPAYSHDSLTWSNADGNLTSASLQFGRVTRATVSDDFTGYECFGTITYPATGDQDRHGAYSLYGRVSVTSAGDPGSATGKSDTLAYVLGALSVVVLLALFALYQFASSQRQTEIAQNAQDKYKSDSDVISRKEDISEVRSDDAVAVLRGSGVRQRIRAGQELVKQESQVERSMTKEELLRFQKANNDLREADTEVSNPPDSAFARFIDTVAAKVNGATTTLGDLFTSLGSKFSAAERATAEESIELIRVQGENLDLINKAWEEDELIPEFAEE